jgi:acetyl esterase/lipase
MEKMRLAHFVTGWMDMKPRVPVPIIDWITDKRLDIAYGADPKQKLDFYRPNSVGCDADRSLPLVVIVHGGGFSRMDKRDWHLYPGFFALREGFSVASVNYRLAPKHPFPAAVDDVNTALDFLLEHAEEYGIDPGNIFLHGTSAGGNLVSLVGLQHPDKIRAVAALCSVSDLTALWDHYDVQPKWRLMRIVVRNMVKQYLNMTPNKPRKSSENTSIRKDRERSDDASVSRYVSPSTPPFYLQHGDADPLIPHAQSIAFRDLLRDHGNLAAEDLALDILEGAGHAGGGPDFFEEKNILRILDFFKRHIR